MKPADPKRILPFRLELNDPGVFGSLLTWMEENRKQVFTIATANNIEGLPPELLRKGCFDKVFFIDLPAPRERANILAIHLTKHYPNTDLFRCAERSGYAPGDGYFYRARERFVESLRRLVLYARDQVGKRTLSRRLSISVDSADFSLKDCEYSGTSWIPVNDCLH